MLEMKKKKKICPLTAKGEVLPQEFGEKIMELPVDSCTSYELPKNVTEQVASILTEYSIIRCKGSSIFWVVKI